MRSRWLISLVLLAVAGILLALTRMPEPEPVAEAVPRLEPAPLDTLVTPALRAATPAARPDKVSFALQVKDEVIPYRIFGLFVMPEETVEIEAVFTEGAPSAKFVAERGEVAPLGPERWAWTAPDAPGVYPIDITDERAGETITLNAFVLTPFDHSERSINGYRLGDYQDRPLRGNPVYNEPPGFVELTDELRDAHVSPNFTLGQFQCKQPGDPKYLLVRERLVLKLEMILEEVRQRGFDVETLHVMSAYRTPHYNASIGNRTKYSRHLYGGAADLFVDADGDNHMDDLTGDGQVTVADAQYLAQIVEGMTDETWYQPFVGGLGIYAPASHRGPFIHVDVRGNRARW